MTKTLLSVPKQTLSRLKTLAQRRQTTVSHLLREAVEKSYGIDAGLKQEVDWKEDPLFKFFVEMGKTNRRGPSDLSENHDKYIIQALGKKSGRKR